ncbi:sodium:calcium antiporter [Sediminibacillus albus]|uniref:Cation:H+ antiporter n=1 Tax=Sediminibacillus albus TaxID=407036 RepID=A0A1G9ANH3_9BACI|nr:sodium:calcium antiporter [Sediminibacillus albus]SDK28384.1 cation:H+ antiporter [Sediminibacillus albus]
MLSILVFLLSAAISVYAAIKLSTYADIISKQTKLGGMLAGTLLLAVATSLPELTATGSAAVIGNADIAVGNGLGSIIFNFLVLFILDIFFRKRRLFLLVSDNHFHTGLLALILCCIAAGSLYYQPSITFLGVGFTSMVIAGVYFVGIWLISIKQNKEKQAEENPVSNSQAGERITKIAISFIVFAFIIFVSGSLMSVSGDWMVDATGISATAVGSLLIAAATSLPDAVGVFIALRVANINLAIGAILGSNLFNIFVVTIADIFYRNGSVWADAGERNIWTALCGLLLTLGVMLLLKRDRTRNSFTYILPSLAAIFCYITFILIIIY